MTKHVGFYADCLGFDFYLGIVRSISSFSCLNIKFLLLLSVLRSSVFDLVINYFDLQRGMQGRQNLRALSDLSPGSLGACHSV